MADDGSQAPGTRGEGLATFLQEQREDVLSEWERAVQGLPCAATLPRPELRNSLPDVLSQIAAYLDRSTAAGSGGTPPVADQHALARLHEGFDNTEVVEELALLRDVVLRLWRPDALDEAHVEQMRRFARAVDQCMVATARRFSDSFESRTLALEASEKRFRDTFESAAVGLGHVSLGGEWRRMNDRYCALLGYTRDELMGMRFEDVTHPGDVASDAASIARLIAGDGDAYASEKRCIRKDGSVVWVDQTLSLVREDGRPSYLIAAAQDISDRVRQREQRAFLADASSVLASTLDYREALDNLAALAAPRIADWCMIDMASSAADVLEPAAIGHADAEAAEALRDMRRRYPMGTDMPGPLGDALRASEPSLVRVDDGLLRSIAADEAHLAELKRFGMTSAVVLPLRIGGRTMGTLTLAQSASGRRFAEQDVELLRELATIASAALDNALLHAETQRAVHLRDRVLGIVTHDLRNPLGTIDLSATLLAMNRAVSGDAAANAQIATIQRNVRRATRLIEDLLDMSSVQAGRFAIDRQQRPLGAILREAADSLRPKADEKQIDFTVEIETGDAMIFGDHDRLLQVLNNVIGNALKFSKAGDIVTVRALRENATVHVTVADTGPGVSAERLDQIFEPYVRVRQNEEGTGLGLFISKAIVDAHGGRIWAESEPGRGTTVHICLPLAG
ncbi:MAG: PAS domain S-box protein [Gammaproteobacteria bacterium]|nr:PAS domain S-box protein [Gammaproteobacteria bacterium]